MANLIVRTSNLIEHTSRIVLRGELDIESSIASIKRDWYQRKENFSIQKTRALMAAIMAGDEFPDITLGMRGHTFNVDDKDTVSLCDPIQHGRCTPKLIWRRSARLSITGRMPYRPSH